MNSVYCVRYEGNGERRESSLSHELGNRFKVLREPCIGVARRCKAAMR